MTPPTTRTARISHHHPLPAPPVSDEVPDGGVGEAGGEAEGEAGVASVCDGRADVGPGADEVAGGADVRWVVGPAVGRVVGAAVGRVFGGVVGAWVGALVAFVGRDGLLVGAMDLVGTKDRDGSSEAVTEGRAAEPLPAAPQPTRRTSAGSTSRQTSASRFKQRRG